MGKVLLGFAALVVFGMCGVNFVMLPALQSSLPTKQPAVVKLSGAITGDSGTVSVTFTNETKRPMKDLQILSVAMGTMTNDWPNTTVALDPGESKTSKFEFHGLAKVKGKVPYSCIVLQPTIDGTDTSKHEGNLMTGPDVKKPKS